MANKSFRVYLDDHSYVLYYEKGGKYYTLPCLWSEKYGLTRPGNVRRISKVNFDRMAVEYNNT